MSYFRYINMFCLFIILGSAGFRSIFDLHSIPVHTYIRTYTSTQTQTYTHRHTCIYILCIWGAIPPSCKFVRKQRDVAKFFLYKFSCVRRYFFISRYKLYKNWSNVFQALSATLLRIIKEHSFFAFN